MQSTIDKALGYIISSKICGFNYYIRITYEGARYPDFIFVGVQDNATLYPDEESAKAVIRKIARRTVNTLHVMPKN